MAYGYENYRQAFPAVEKRIVFSSVCSYKGLYHDDLARFAVVGGQ